MMGPPTAAVVVCDWVAFCTRCRWSSYLVSGVDPPPHGGMCPRCESKAAAVPSPRVQESEIGPGFAEEIARALEAAQERAEARRDAYREVLKN